MNLLREPLLHFVALGAVLFLLFRFVAEPEEAANEIVVTSARIDSLAATFTRTWQRPPTARELDGLIQDHVREEILYREALALGLDRDDTIIRRRLRQKMEFIADDVAAQVEPTDEQLAAHLREYASEYRVADRYTFHHLYFDPERHEGDLEQTTRRVLDELAAADVPLDAGAHGDPFILPHEFRDQSEAEIAAALGDSFAAALRRLPPARWSGPIASEYGVHLVYIDERQGGRDPELSEIRDQVRRDWERRRRLESNDRLFQDLLAGYRVRVDAAPQAPPASRSD